MSPWSFAAAAALHQSLPPFGVQVDGQPMLAAYRDYYGLNFDGVARHRIGKVVSGPYALATQLYEVAQPRANLLLVHGLFDHTGLYGRLIEFGLAQRCNVLIFDLPGHGLSSGAIASIGEFAEYADCIDAVLAAADLPELPLWAMGQSTGCAALIERASRGHWPFDHTVLLAPLVRPAQWHLINTAHHLIHRFVEQVPRGFAENSSDKAFLRFIKADPLQSQHTSLEWLAALRRWLKSLHRGDLGVGPVMIVQGDADGTVDWRYNVPVVQKLFPGSELFEVAGGGHQLANESDALRQPYLEAVARYVGLA